MRRPWVTRGSPVDQPRVGRESRAGRLRVNRESPMGHQGCHVGNPLGCPYKVASVKLLGVLRTECPPVTIRLSGPYSTPRIAYKRFYSQHVQDVKYIARQTRTKNVN